MSISIPEPKRQKNVAVNQHMIPRCYMKNWGYNAKKTSVWIYDKENRYNEENPDWTIESKTIYKINSLNCFHDFRAGYMYMPEEALNEIFEPLKDFVICDEGELLDSNQKLNSHYYNYDKWEISNKDGQKLCEYEKKKLYIYLKESRYTFVETEWARTYENSWVLFIHLFYKRISKLRREKDNGIKSTISITNQEIYKLIQYSVIYNWRSIQGNEIFNNVIKSSTMDILKKIEIPEEKRVYENDIMAIDEVIHVKRINDFFDFLKNDRGLIKKNIDDIYENLIPIIYLTDGSKKFITSNEPSFTYTGQDGMNEMIFVALPNMLISFVKGNKGIFHIKNATQKKVDELNKIIADRGKLLILPEQNYDIEKLFL